MLPHKANLFFKSFIQKHLCVTKSIQALVFGLFVIKGLLYAIVVLLWLIF